MNITKAEWNILDHLAPVEYGLYRDTYLCGISVENKDRYMYSVMDKVREWVEKNGGKFAVLSGKVIIHDLNKKGHVVQIHFPCYGERDMKNLMSAMFYGNMKMVYIAQ